MQTLNIYIAKHHKTHVIFDFDATLFLLVIPWSEWIDKIKNTLIDYDSSIWDTYHQKIINISELQNQYMKNHGIAVREFLRTSNQEFEASRLEAVKHNHELLSVVRSLDSSIKKYIWSSNSKKTIERILQETDLEKTFTSIVTRDDVDFLKPDPEGFQHIYNPRIPKSKYVLVGDSESDKKAAMAAKIDFYFTGSFDRGR